jgi:hypothetical protein
VQKDEYKVASSAIKTSFYGQIVSLISTAVLNSHLYLLQTHRPTVWPVRGDILWSIVFLDCTFLALGATIKKKRMIERCCFVSIHFQQHRFLLRLISRRRRSGLFALHPSLILNLSADCFVLPPVIGHGWIRIRTERRSAHLRKLSRISHLAHATVEDPRFCSRSNRATSEARRSRLSKVIRRDASKFGGQIHPRNSSPPNMHEHCACLLPRRRKSYPGKLHFPVLPEA